MEELTKRYSLRLIDEVEFEEKQEEILREL